MMTSAELGRAAAKMGLGLGQAEHEYALLCFLDGLSQTPSLSETLCLKGGTALRQIYYADWRHSVDLDFSTLPPFDSEGLQDVLNEWFEHVRLLHDMDVSLLSIHKPNGAARIRARFVGPLNHPGRMLLDLTFDEPVLLSPLLKRTVSPFCADLSPMVLVYALEEILAEKLRAIIERGKSRDYYDAWRLLKEKQSDLDLVVAIRVLLQKCVHKDLGAPTVQRFLAPKVLEAAEAYWSRDLADQIPGVDPPPWGKVVEELRDLLAAFLGGD